MVRDDFAVFILTHGRPEKIITVETLKRCGYTGKWYLILDDEDKTIEKHKEMFGEEHCVVFSKDEAASRFDVYDNFDGRNVIVYARNMCFDIARSLGLNYFAEFEDDYEMLRFRFPEGGSLRAREMRNFDDVAEACCTFLDDAPRVRTIAWAQSGELFGGLNGSVWKEKVKRKAMNTFFFKICDPKDDFYFPGRFNDDVNAYTVLGQRGEIFLQTPVANLNQVNTQKQKGGNADAYLQYGTYTKSFYSVLACPHSVKVSVLGTGNRRIHHAVEFGTCVPKIISDRFKVK